MADYVITANGSEMGIYQAFTEGEALEAYAKDAGYESYAALVEQHGEAEAEEYDPDVFGEWPLQ